MADSLLQEVDEALRADRMAAAWQKHKSTVIGIVIALVVGAAANSAWQHYREAHGGKTLEQLVTTQKLLDAGKAEEAAKGFGEVANSTSGDLKSLALVWQARAFVAANKKDEAINVLKTASAGSTLWSDVACLRLAALDAAAAKPCLENSNSSPLSGERAQWAAAGKWQAGDSAAAKANLEKLIADENTSQEARAHMMQWLAIIKSQEAKK